MSVVIIFCTLTVDMGSILDPGLLQEGCVGEGGGTDDIGIPHALLGCGAVAGPDL